MYATMEAFYYEKFYKKKFLDYLLFRKGEELYQAEAIIRPNPWLPGYIRKYDVVSYIGYQWLILSDSGGLYKVKMVSGLSVPIWWDRSVLERSPIIKLFTTVPR